MNKHSPGPWQLVERDGDFTLRDADGEHVQYLRASRYGDNRTDETALANVRLIRIAPELLTSLEEICDLVLAPSQLAEEALIKIRRIAARSIAAATKDAQ